MMIEPTESESLAELDRFCEAMIAIREEIRAIERGTSDRQDNPLKRAPHTADLLLADWTRPYPKDQAFFPTAATRPTNTGRRSARVDNVYGDRHLVCSARRWRRTSRRRSRREGAARPPRGLPWRLAVWPRVSTIFSGWSSEVSDWKHYL